VPGFDLTKRFRVTITKIQNTSIAATAVDQEKERKALEPAVLEEEVWVV